MDKPTFVLDASVVLSWCFEDETSPYADAVLESLAETVALAPAIWPLEIGNVLVVTERRSRLDNAASVRFLSLLRQLPITVEQETAGRMFGEILTLTHGQQLSTYDASYLDLAMRADLPLATQDSALRQAAVRCGAEIYLASTLDVGSGAG